jgi:cytochrome oxidase Cu insertion factor (SCO1/SenC/PrrC family)
MSETVRGNRRTLYLLIVLFFLPVAAAFYLYYGATWRPVGQTNHGVLITPARALPVGLVDLRGKWSLVYIGNGRCDEACRTALIFARQTRLSLNQEMHRVARVFLVTGDCCDRDYLDTAQAGLQVVEASDAAGAALLAAFPATDRADSLYIVDPLGNLLMRYDVRESPKGLLTDLQKLLKLSHIG